MHFKIKTSTEEQKKITIKNPYSEPATYKVESDIDEMITVPQFVYIDSNGEASINVTMESLMPNKSIGYLKFTDEKDRFFWYTLTVESYDDNTSEKALEISCKVGKTVEKFLEVCNPTNQKLKFQISYP
jgi:hypothetical protein